MKNKKLVVIGCDTRGEGYCDILIMPECDDIESYLEELGHHNFHYQVVSSIYTEEENNE